MELSSVNVEHSQLLSGDRTALNDRWDENETTPPMSPHRLGTGTKQDRALSTALEAQQTAYEALEQVNRQDGRLNTQDLTKAEQKRQQDERINSQWYP